MRIERPALGRMVGVYVCLCGLASLLLGCSSSSTPWTGSPLATETSSLARTSMPSPTATTTPALPGPQVITLWITEKVSPIAESAQSQILAQQISAFEATHPDTAIEVHYKKPDGKGGISDFLSTASAVAPAVVPDVVVVDPKTLADLTVKGLLVPLDGLLSQTVLNDLYPIAVVGGTVDGRLMGVPFEANIEHAIYNTSKIAVAPITWEEVFASGATYIFPTAGQDGLVNEAFLVQYLSTGGQLVDEDGGPALDQQALTDVLGFYQRGIESGAILTDVLDYATVEQCWPKYLQAEVVMSNISSKLYLAGRGLLTVSRPTAVPIRDGQAIALSEGHAWAMATMDPNRQQLAAELMEWLLYPGNMAAWNRAAGSLPTRRSAIEEMDRDPYAAFLLMQMEYVIPYPRSEMHQRIYRAMQDAVDAVLREGAIPEVAAEGILTAVNQEISR